jgi:hypothetical protein
MSVKPTSGSVMKASDAGSAIDQTSRLVTVKGKLGRIFIRHP